MDIGAGPVGKKGKAKMTGSQTAKKAREEGYQAAKAGKSADVLPYDYRFEAIQAYSWDEGYREGKK